MKENINRHILNILTSESLFVIAGPCVVESENICFEVAEELKRIRDELGIDFIFKSSYRKANRTSHESFRGIGDLKALEILKNVRQTFDLPVVTDVHESNEVPMAAEYVDMLQIPAFLCRQTMLLTAAARSGKPINLKKGQFMSAESMRFAVEKIHSEGNQYVVVSERGNSFGYEDLVVDFRNIPRMKLFGVKVVMDCTHSLQRPNLKAGTSGGEPEFVQTMVNAGVSVGADGLFLEVHPDPGSSRSDSRTMLPMNQLYTILMQARKIRDSL